MIFLAEKVVPILLPIAFTIFGFLWTLGFTIFVVRRRAFLKRALETNGTVIDVEVKHRLGMGNSLGSTHHYPTVRFQTADGQTVDCKINISLHEFYEVGQPVIVNYDAQNPCKSTQLGDRESQPVGTYILFIGGGAIFLLIGLTWSLSAFVL